MKADLSRVTFQPRKHFAGVIHQQGRVIVDADLNEQQAITAYRAEVESADALGQCATPLDPATGLAGGFEIRPATDGTTLVVGAGRFYVDGILCEAEEAFGVHAQPDLPAEGTPMVPGAGQALRLPARGTKPPGRLRDLDADGKQVDPQDGFYVVFLEAWRRHVTALEDDDLREVALGGPDTSTRLKTIAQVRLLRVGDAGATCASPGRAWTDHAGPVGPDGTLAAQAEPTEAPKGACALSPKAGYRRLENQLYRVEVHGIDEHGAVTLKWSRDNGCIEVRCLPDQAAGTDIGVTTLGRDAALGIGGGTWVELIDDRHELLGLTGQLLELDKAQDDLVTVTTKAELPDYPVNPRLRRWDGVVTGKASWTLLEDGVEVKLEAGTLRAGDHWLIPARTETGTVEWPRDGDAAVHLAPHREVHHRCKLAVVAYRGGAWSLVEDCRPRFPAATDHVNLHYVGGDGQTAAQDMRAPGTRAPLPRPLQVGVTNGKWPVQGARVRFGITVGDGRLQGTDDKAEVVVETDDRGLAACTWALATTLPPADAPASPPQAVEAVLLESGRPSPYHLPVRFSAQLLRARDVPYDPSLCDALEAAGATDVQKAIDELYRQTRGGGCCLTVGEGGDHPTLAKAVQALLRAKMTSACLCLLPGGHSAEDWPGEGRFEDKYGTMARTRLHIRGAGRATWVTVTSAPVWFAGFASIALESFDLVRSGGLGEALVLQGGGEIALRDVDVTAILLQGSAVRIDGAETFILDGCLVEAFDARALRWLGEAFQRLPRVGEKLRAVFELATPSHVTELARVCPSVAELPEATRAAFAKEAGPFVRKARKEGIIGDDEVAALLRFVSACGGKVVDQVELLAAFADLRPVMARERPAIALLTDEARGDAAIHLSRFTGTVSIDGTGGPLPGNALATAREKLLASLGKERAVLQAMQCRFDLLLVGQGLTKRELTTRQPVSGLYRRLLVDGSVIAVPGLQLLGVHVHLGANLLGPHRQPAGEKARPVRIGVVLASSAALIGNTNASENASILCGTGKPPRVSDVGNLGLTVESM